MDAQKPSADMQTGSSSRSAHLPAKRWKPTAGHLQILETFYQGHKAHVATQEKIRYLHGMLLPYGDVESHSVFYWLNNRRARDKERKRLFPAVPEAAPPGSSQERHQG